MKMHRAYLIMIKAWLSSLKILFMSLFTVRAEKLVNRLSLVNKSDNVYDVFCIKLPYTLIFCHFLIWKSNQQTICYHEKSRKKGFNYWMAQFWENLFFCLQIILSLEITSRHKEHQVSCCQCNRERDKTSLPGYNKLFASIYIIFYFLINASNILLSFPKASARKDQWERQITMFLFLWSTIDK
jgi:hypothetical protein